MTLVFSFALLVFFSYATEISETNTRLQDLNLELNTLCNKQMEELVRKASNPCDVMVEHLQILEDDESEDSFTDGMYTESDPYTCKKLAIKAQLDAEILFTNKSNLDILREVTEGFNVLRATILLNMNEITMIRIRSLQNTDVEFITEIEVTVKKAFELCDPVLRRIDDILELFSELSISFKKIKKRLNQRVYCLMQSFKVYSMEVENLDEDINGIFEELEVNPAWITSRTLGSLYAFYLKYKESYGVYAKLHNALSHVKDKLPAMFKGTIQAKLSNQVSTYFKSFQTCSEYYQTQQKLTSEDCQLILSDSKFEFTLFRDEFYHYRNICSEKRNNLPDKRIYQMFFSVPNNPHLSRRINICYTDTPICPINNCLVVNGLQSDKNTSNRHWATQWFTKDNRPDFYDLNCKTPTLGVKGIKRCRSLISTEFHAAIKLGLNALFIGKIDTDSPMCQIAQLYAECSHILAGHGIETVCFSDKCIYDLIGGSI